MWAEPFDLRYLERGRWQVLGGLVFHDPMRGPLRVPAGAETDLATVRPLRTAALAGLVLGALLALLAGLVPMLQGLFSGGLPAPVPGAALAGAPSAAPLARGGPLAALGTHQGKVVPAHFALEATGAPTLPPGEPLPASARPGSPALLPAGLASPVVSALLALALLAHALGALALLLYATVVGYGDRAAALHDWLYRARIMPRAHADAVFHRALRADGIARWRAALMWAGVRVGGGWAWRRARRR